MHPKRKTEVDSLFKMSAMRFQGPYLSDSDDPLERIISKFWNSELPSITEMQNIIENSTKLFLKEPNVLELKSPIILCGDVHGHFYDLLEVFRIGGLPPSSKYLFLGDYVDRGDKGAEILMLLCALKLKYPQNIYLIRGNHESGNVTSYYGFRDEILVKFRSEFLYKAYESLFNSLPISATINKKIFCVHGGLSPHIKKIEDISSIDRFTEIPESGPLCDLVWNDPTDIDCAYTDSRRNVGYCFGIRATNEFMKTNNINLIIRAHEMKQEGFEYCHENHVLTIFSAPNYDTDDDNVPNKGALMVIDENMGKNIIKFGQAPSPETKWERLRYFVY